MSNYDPDSFKARTFFDATEAFRSGTDSPRDYLERCLDAIETRELDRIRVIWRPQPVTIYEAISRKGDLPTVKAEVIGLYAEGLKHYRNRDWTKALSVFDKVLWLDPGDGPSQTLKTRCETFLMDPPEWTAGDWDGALNL